MSQQQPYPLNHTELGHRVGESEPESLGRGINTCGTNDHGLFVTAASPAWIRARGYWVCTRFPNHSGPHIAHMTDAGEIYAIWADIPASLRVSDGL